LSGQPATLGPDAAELARHIEVKITPQHGPAIILPLATVPPPNNNNPPQPP
jgi:hypothetical protein